MTDSSKKTSFRTRLIVAFCSLFFTLIVLGGGGFWWAYQQIQKPLTITDSLVFEIKPGQTLTQVTYALANKNIIAQPEVLLAYSKFTQQTHIQYGEYQLQPDMNWMELNQRFIAGDVIERSVTLVEGLTIREVLDTLKNNPYLKKELTGPNDSKLLQLLPNEHPHPEGWFFADTYAFRKGDSDLNILNRAHQKMYSTLNALWQSRDVGLPFSTPYEALILASIVEKETALPSERPEIAGVFVRRLQKNMRLQTDPTVIYGLGDQYQGNLKRSHLKQVNDYNTYVIRGLPPTPIALVGQESLEAVFNPANGSALYFVAKGDGSHQFSDTLAEHNRAVREFQISNRRKDYQSTPNQ